MSASRFVCGTVSPGRDRELGAQLLERRGEAIEILRRNTAGTRPRHRSGGSTHPVLHRCDPATITVFDLETGERVDQRQKVDYWPGSASALSGDGILLARDECSQFLGSGATASRPCRDRRVRIARWARMPRCRTRVAPRVRRQATAESGLRAGVIATSVRSPADPRAHPRAR